MLCVFYQLFKIRTINARLPFNAIQSNGFAKRSEIVSNSVWFILKVYSGIICSGFTHQNSNSKIYSSVSQLQSWRATYQNDLDVSPIKTPIQLVSFLECWIGRHLKHFGRRVPRTGVEKHCFIGSRRKRALDEVDIYLQSTVGNKTRKDLQLFDRNEASLYCACRLVMHSSIEKSKSKYGDTFFL